MVRTEPVLIATAIRATLLAVMAFGIHITDAQLAAVMLAVESVLAVITRAAVTPNVKVAAQAEALAQQRMADAQTPDPVSTMQRVIREDEDL